MKSARAKEVMEIRIIMDSHDLVGARDSELRVKRGLGRHDVGMVLQLAAAEEHALG